MVSVRSLVATVFLFVGISKSDGDDYLYKKNDYRTVDKVYDYIVVGGGSAGGMTAMRLASFGYKTLLIEAGPELEPNHYNVTVPALNLRASEDPKISLDFFVKHYPESTNLRQKVFYPRVAGLGGCSLHHALYEVYPQQQDFDKLFELTGNPVFKEENFREKYFKTLEDNQYPPFVSNPNNHGSKGWLPISYYAFYRLGFIDLPLIEFYSFLLGNPFHDVNGYVNGKLGTSFDSKFLMPSGVHTNNFTRMNYLGQLQMARHFTPLTILTDTLATKINFDSNKKATSVNVLHGKYLYKASPLYSQSNFDNAVKNTFTATKEIIISGGTLMTPQLLMLSGIGDSEELKKFGIDVISNLKGVGKNLQDRYEIPYISKFNKELTLLKDCSFQPDETRDRCFKNYKETKTGPYIGAAALFSEIKSFAPNITEPDTFFINVPINFHGYFKGYSEEASRDPRYFTQLILKARTKSEGYVKLTSSNPNDVPDINLMKFNKGGKDDLNALIDAVIYARKRTIAGTGGRYEEVLPGKDIQTREQIGKWIVDITWGHHVCCTAKIGLDKDPMAVLDSRFRVRGVKGLRVVDMSVFPEIPGFFPNLFVHMIGNTVADFIHEDNKGLNQDFKSKNPEKTFESKYDEGYHDFDPLKPSV